MFAGFELGDLFWLVIIAVSILAQIAKVLKRTPGRGAPPEQPGQPPDSEGKTVDLEEFLRRLAGDEPQAPRAPPESRTAEPAAPAPPPVRRVEPRPKPAAPVVARRARPRVQHRAPPPPPPAPVVIAQPLAPPAAAPVLEPQPRAVAPAAPAAPALQPALQDASAPRAAQLAQLRLAVVWREVLGPPVALRRDQGPLYDAV